LINLQALHDKRPRAVTFKTNVATRHYLSLPGARRPFLPNLVFFAVFFTVITTTATPFSPRAEAAAPLKSAQSAQSPSPRAVDRGLRQGASASLPALQASPPAPSRVPAAARAQPPTIGRTFAGERLVYEIGFWFFEKVAEAELTLTPEKGGYRAVLRAWTTGFVDKVIQHRSDVYTAHLVEADGGRRFATVSLESSSDVNGKVRRSVKKVDRKAGTLYSRSWGGGKEEKKKVVRFTPGTFIDDPLGGFYNFRFGVYGKPGAKKEFAIKTLPQKDDEDAFIRMKVEPYKQRPQDLAGEQQKPGATSKTPAYLARVMMSREVFGTDLSDIDIYFSEDLVPLLAEARDLVLFTDVRGTLKSRTASDERRKKRSGEENGRKREKGRASPAERIKR